MACCGYSVFTSNPSLLPSLLERPLLRNYCRNSVRLKNNPSTNLWNSFSLHSLNSVPTSHSYLYKNEKEMHSVYYSRLNSE